MAKRSTKSATVEPVAVVESVAVVEPVVVEQAVAVAVSPVAVEATRMTEHHITLTTAQFIALPLDEFATEFVWRLRAYSFPTLMRRAADRLATILQGVVEGSIAFDEAHDRLDKAFTFFGKQWVVSGDASSKKRAVLHSIRDMQRKLMAELEASSPSFNEF